MPTATFLYTGGYQYWTVPDGVTSVTLAINGAGSGGVHGGRVTGHAAVSGGQQLQIIVGAQGDAGASSGNGGSHGWGGGGAGGDGNNAAGGDGGGGYSLVRRTGGTIFGIAGGAGGTSGDNGLGGEGGSTTGAPGSRGTSGSGSTGDATGGTQSQGGNGGTSSSGSDFAGGNASDTAINVYGGTGGSSTYHSHGGGGGGGGYHAGGGGQASSFGFAPGGGGGGGSNYSGGMTSATNVRGGGNVTTGGVTITWTTPPPASQPPSVPTTAKINGVDETPGYATKSTGSVNISAHLSDPDDDNVRLLVRYSSHSDFSGYLDKYSAYESSPHDITVGLTGLAQNVHYYVRLYAQDTHGLYSVGYNTLDFWTNRPPNPPTLTAPAENATIPALSSIVFTWTHSDPDPSDSQTGFELQYRTAETITQPAGPWGLISGHSIVFGTWTINPGSLKGSTFYEWTVRTKDEQGTWGDWAVTRSFFVSSASSPPRLTAPIGNVAVNMSEDTFLDWTFIDPDPGDSQTKADVRYRIVGQTDAQWITEFGTTLTPGANSFFLIPALTFVPGYHYEWQARTYDTFGGLASDWSASAQFWTTGTPGEALAFQRVVPSPFIKGRLGCGEYRAYLFFQGGEKIRGELNHMNAITAIEFGRTRDDISQAKVTITVNPDCTDDYIRMLGQIESWIHELVLYRKVEGGDWERAWEGPITLPTWQGNTVTIQAQDVMVYPFRRILRQGYNDAYQLLNGQQIGLPSVVSRAERILMNALAPWDPNILKYLTAFQFPDDARESRVVPDYSRTAWEEVDDMASNAGLDYTVVGRRIILWDTHRPIGRLPELRDSDFSDSPIISQYGMQLCNYAAVTNGNGVWGHATPIFVEPPDTTVNSGGFNRILNPGGDPIIIHPVGETPFNRDPFQSYGPIEMLASAYGESATGGDDVLTPAAKAALVSAMTDQAKRNINDRWPTPMQVRVPDNSTLSPECGITFDQLVPGVWMPLRSTQFLRTVEQWQKLDSVSVTWDAQNGEKVNVVLSPAPNAGQDPDADSAAADAAG